MKPNMATQETNQINWNVSFYLLMALTAVTVVIFDSNKNEELSLIFSHLCTVVSWGFMAKAIPEWIILGKALKEQENTGVAKKMPVFRLSLYLVIALIFNQLPNFIPVTALTVG